MALSNRKKETDKGINWAGNQIFEYAKVLTRVFCQLGILGWFSRRTMKLLFVGGSETPFFYTEASLVYTCSKVAYRFCCGWDL